jgi:HNH endonuclease
MKHVHVRHRMTIGPVNRCIYCDATGVKLTDEHIVPKGIGGRLELLQSSCEPCQRKIQPVEDELMNFPFQPARRAHDLRGHQGRRGRPITIRHKTTNQPLSIPVADFPVYYPLAKFLPGPPLLLLGQPQDLPLLCDWQIVYADALADRDAKFAKLGLKLADIVQFPRPRLFARFLAKIAHAYASAQHFDGHCPDFQPYLHKLARGDTPISGRTLIGNAPTPNSTPPGPGHFTTLLPIPPDRKTHLGCEIRLFGSITPWTYLVIVGRLK